METGERIIVALDVSDEKSAGKLIEKILPCGVVCFKIGLEFITAVGVPRAVGFVRSNGGEVFFDGKFLDIPKTIGKAAAVLKDVKFFNIHISPNMEMMKQAVINKGNAKVLGVTELTSVSPKDFWNIYHKFFTKPCREFHSRYTLKNLHKVIREKSQLAFEAGLDGIICSPADLEFLKKYWANFENLLKVTPGIRPRWAVKHDQQRITTPSQAIEFGADYLVIGRPITGHPDPVEAAKLIIEEIDEVLEGKL